MKPFAAWMLALLLGAGMAAAAAVPGSDPPLTLPDLKTLEPAVAGPLDEAQKRLDQVGAAEGPEKIAAYGELAQLYHAHNLREPAEAAYRNAIRLAPTDFRWQHLLGLLLKDAGRLDEAAAAFVRAVDLKPADTPARVYQAEILRLQGKTEAAEALAREALALQPTLTAATALLGQTALDRRDFAAAIPLLEKALAAAPDANRLHYLLATAYRGRGTQEDAARVQEHLARAGQVGVAPPDPLLAEVQSLRAGERLFLMRGKTAYDRGRYAEAAEEMRRALSANPASLEARINLAAALAQLGDPAAAVLQLREAVRQAPDNATARFNLGSLLAAQGSSAEAVEQLGAAVKLRPGDAEARRILARTLRDGGKLTEALEQYNQAVRTEPSDDTARMGEAETLVRLERYAEARDRLEEGLRALPSSELLTRGLARLLAACPDRALRDGNRALALAQALRLANPTPDHAALQALALAELGRCAEAATWQRTALAEAPSAGLAALMPAWSEALARYEQAGQAGSCRP